MYHYRRNAMTFRLPPKCPSCAAAIPRAAAGRCPSCHYQFAQFVPRGSVKCRRCDATIPFQGGTALTCATCRSRRPSRLAA
jgi:Zn finger protein HypA/HybF involved in hydrogenase expression